MSVCPTMFSPVVQLVATRAVNQGVVSLNPSLANILSDV